MAQSVAFTENWQKLGIILDKGFLPEWASSYVQHPTVLLNKENPDAIFIYFATRDWNNQSFPIRAEYNVKNMEVVSVSTEPVLMLGKPGSFDEYGVMPSSFIDTSEGLLMYYFGVSQDKNYPIRNAIGVAKSLDNGKTFHRFVNGPVLDRGPEVPLFASSPCVAQREASLWEMFFLRGIKWEHNTDTWRAFYDVALAESKNGIHWDVQPKSELELVDGECAIARPYIVQDALFRCDDSIGTRMYFCSRRAKARYSLGVAHWDKITKAFKRGKLNLFGESSGWDLEEQAYPCQFVWNNNEYLLYNGNNFGEGGLGIARRVMS